MRLGTSAVSCSLPLGLLAWKEREMALIMRLTAELESRSTGERVLCRLDFLGDYPRSMEPRSEFLRAISSSRNLIELGASRATCLGVTVFTLSSYVVVVLGVISVLLV